MPPSITIKEFHATTGEHVRRIGASRTAVIVTDRGEQVAVLANPSLLEPKRCKRTLMPRFATLMKQAPGEDLSEDLAAVRGDR